MNRKDIDPTKCPAKETGVWAVAVIGAPRSEYYLKEFGSVTNGAGISTFFGWRRAEERIASRL